MTEDSRARKVLCNCCPRPFAVVRNGMLIIESRHGGDMHPNGFTPEELRTLANEIESYAKLQDKVA
jgi:hypothetical protein